MIQTLIKNWWLLVLCGVFEAIISIGNFNHAGQGFAWKSAILFLGKLTLAAGVCAITAGILRSAKAEYWLLVLNGLALVMLGLIFTGIFGSTIRFRTVALLIIVMAMSLGIFELFTARTLRSQRRIADVWFFDLAGIVSVGFALAFFALGFGWIRLNPSSPGQTLIWIGSYFGFSAICMLVLALRLGPSQSGNCETLSPLGSPRHAH